MPKTIQIIDGVEVGVSSPDKEFWPEGITKTDVIKYYHLVLPPMMPLVKNRPLALIRYPEGLTGEHFYFKHRPEQAPEWLPRCDYNEVTYMCVQKEADLVYMVNLAALEIHTMNISCDRLSHPDTMIFDLDPGPYTDFESLKLSCEKLCTFLEERAFHPFVKTSGSRGLHIYIPIKPTRQHKAVVDTARKLGKDFLLQHPDVSLELSKEKRGDKIFIDVNRNHPGQHCVAPFSTRAKAGAPVSMPILRKDVLSLKSPAEFTIHNAHAYMVKYQPWHDFTSAAVDLPGRK
ncbi:MAG: non-homologous end-joining DNA ligase [Saprospiraceae bacterium]|nr:non-homologous end-joining DNA ligase [Saprospiraceae bacterium]